MDMHDREKALENKFAHDQQTEFRIEARASRLIGLWAAEKLGLQGADIESYARDVITANLDEPGYDDVKRKILKDFDDRNMDFSDHMIDTIIERKITEARKQIESDGHP
jgi:hypothetical protein